MGSFDEKSAKFYAAQTLSVIGFMHGRGVIHRDIKPEKWVSHGVALPN